MSNILHSYRELPLPARRALTVAAGVLSVGNLVGCGSQSPEEQAAADAIRIERYHDSIADLSPADRFTKEYVWERSLTADPLCLDGSPYDEYSENAGFSYNSDNETLTVYPGASSAPTITMMHYDGSKYMQPVGQASIEVLDAYGCDH